MHPNPIYRTDEQVKILSFATERGFGTLALNGAAGPLISHVPFVIDGGTVARLHLMRSNPIARALAEGSAGAVLAVNGPDSYISPDWYQMVDQVPTWNYVAVHLRGRLKLAPEGDLRAYVEQLSAAFEARLAPKTPWTLSKTSGDVTARLMRMILPVELEIESTDGTWKLAQNKPKEARHAAADHLEPGGIGSELAALAALMRAVD